MATWEILRSPSQCRAIRRLKSTRALDQLAALGDCEVTQQYNGKCDWLIIWGATAPLQKDAFNKHRASGRNVLCLDLGYFKQEKNSVRISINAPHPQNIMKFANGPRPGFVVPELNDIYYNPEGPIMIIGMGPKTRNGYGFPGMSWEKEQIKKIREVFPDRRIMYRPKPNQIEVLDGCGSAGDGDIEHALRGVALAIVYGSNVAIDCALRGIPCVAYNGAGRFAYPEQITRNPERLLGDARADFLHRVAWFNWLPEQFSEMKQFAITLSEAANG